MEFPVGYDEIIERNALVDRMVAIGACRRAATVPQRRESWVPKWFWCCLDEWLALHPGEFAADQLNAWLAHGVGATCWPRAPRPACWSGASSAGRPSGCTGRKENYDKRQAEILRRAGSVSWKHLALRMAGRRSETGCVVGAPDDVHCGNRILSRTLYRHERVQHPVKTTGSSKDRVDGRRDPPAVDDWYGDLSDEPAGGPEIPWPWCAAMACAAAVVWLLRQPRRELGGTPVWQWLVLLLLLGATEWVLLGGVLDR